MPKTQKTKDKLKILLATALCMCIALAAMLVLRGPNRPHSNPAATTDAGTTHILENPTGGEEMPRNRRISATEAYELMQRYPEAIILDVRTADEFEAGHIPGAVLLPDFDIAEKARDILPDPEALILIYCRSGVRSRGAMGLLLSMGYVNVYDFGGINDWPYDVTVEQESDFSAFYQPIRDQFPRG